MFSNKSLIFKSSKLALFVELLCVFSLTMQLDKDTMPDGIVSLSK